MSETFRVSDLINCDAVAIKEQIFEDSNALFDTIGAVVVNGHKPTCNKSLFSLSASIFRESLVNRATHYPIGTGGGILLPHGHVPAINQFIGVFIKLTARQTFKELPDGKPVDLIFALFGPKDECRTDLRLLVYLAHIFSSHNIRAELREALSTEQIYQILINPTLPSSSVSRELNPFTT